MESKTVMLNGQPSKYIIYADGRLYNKETNKFLKGTRHGNYLVYTMRHNNKSYYERAHRLVALHFLPNPQNLPIVDHIDGDTWNNHVDNLRWVDYSTNNINHHKSINDSLLQNYEDDNDIWRPYRDSIYLISQTGKVKNKITNTLLKGKLDQYGYIYYHLRDTINKNVWGHRAVWECFGGNLVDGLIINHIDGNKTNNHIDNLEQITSKKNREHSIEVLHPELQHKVYQYDLEGKLIAIYKSINECARLLNLDSRAISANMRGEKSSYKNFIFCASPSDFQVRKKRTLATPIAQYTLDGQLIRKFKTITEAIKITGFSRSNIINCLNGKYKTANGYKWKRI